MHILALAAHPDDPELFCGGTLLRYLDAGHSVFIALTTSGNIGSTTHASREEIAGVREGEALAGAEVLGARVRFLRFDDEGLRDTEEARRAVLEAMRWAQPDVILTHHPSDPSTDHGMTGRLVARMMLSLPAPLAPASEPPCDKKPSLFFWDVIAGGDFRPEAYVDISATFDRKLEALTRHESQVSWMGEYMEDSLPELTRAMNRYRGMQCGVRYAEAFCAHRIHGFMPDFKLLP
jgi:LmbE family N-acetylglucosaminyl deacetylase